MGRGEPALVLFISMFLLIAVNSAGTYGLLRTFGSQVGDSGVTHSSAYDIEVDREGIYISGLSYSEGRQNFPLLVILNRDHTHRCSTSLVFEVDGQPLTGVATSVKANLSHVFVAGIIGGGTGPGGGGKPVSMVRFELFVAVFDKNCNLDKHYTYFLADSDLAIQIPLFYGEGVDLVLDETGVYIVTGLTILLTRTPGFLLLHLDHSLKYVKHTYLFVEDAASSFATSIAIYGDYLYVAGGLGFVRDIARFESNGLFLLKLNKTDFSYLNSTHLNSGDSMVFFSGMEAVVDDAGDVYFAYNRQNYGSTTGVSVVKLDQSMNVLWTNDYNLNYSYSDASMSNTPPTNTVSKFVYGLSAAVSDSLLYIGGFVSESPLTGKGDLLNGVLLAVDKSDGEALFAFRIRDVEGETFYSLVYSVDSFGSCVYLAGVSDSYRLEYIYMNNYNTLSSTEVERGQKPNYNYMDQQTSYTVHSRPFTPIFDTNLGYGRYGVYGVFCPGDLLRSTFITVTSTRTETTTTTSTHVDTIITTQTLVTIRTSTRLTTTTITSYSTVTMRRVVEEYNVIYATSYLTREVFTTSTAVVSETQTVKTTVADTVTYTLIDFTRGAPETYGRGDVANVVTTTMITTLVRDNIVVTTTTAVSIKETGLSPWFYLPFFLLPIPFAALLVQGRRHVMVIRRHSEPPAGWTSEKTPLVDDTYLKPSIVSIKKGGTVVFINEDNVPHIVFCYEGPEKHLFTSPPIKPGKKWKHKFIEPGIYYISSLEKPYIGGVIRVAG